MLALSPMCVLCVSKVSLMCFYSVGSQRFSPKPLGTSGNLQSVAGTLALALTRLRSPAVTHILTRSLSNTLSSAHTRTENNTETC
jgi:hypothetical protein